MSAVRNVLRAQWRETLRREPFQLWLLGQSRPRLAKTLETLAAAPSKVTEDDVVTAIASTHAPASHRVGASFARRMADGLARRFAQENP